MCEVRVSGTTGTVGDDTTAEYGIVGYALLL